MNWKSFIKPIVLYQAVSSRGTRIEVRERSGVHELYLDGYPQTQKSYRKDWKKVLKNIKSEETLLLGLGGGDVVRLLTGCKITVVELEPEVVAVARDYFGITPNEKLRVVTEDAGRFIAQNKKQYDLVVVDIYSGDGVPEFVEGTEFLQQVWLALDPSGTALFNYASHSFGKDDFEKFEGKLRKLFECVKKYVIWGHTFYIVQKIEK